MAAIINALDSYTPTQVGENGHVEYGWSNDTREKILQFNFQLVRTEDDGIHKLQLTLKSILQDLKSKISGTNIFDREVGKGLLSLLYRMIGNTRDITDGKGECKLTYMMICTWFDFYPELAYFAVKCLVNIGSNIHQYGSWKDIKYFCDYCKNYTRCDRHPLIHYAVYLMNEQLRSDYANYISNSYKDISLAAKWVPREKSAFGWLYESFATNYFENYMNTAETLSSQQKAILKCKTDYRKLISALNKVIDTLQIKQCNNNWSSIEFNKVTSISLSKQKKAFLNIKKNGEVRYPESKDRVTCAINFNNHIQEGVKGNIEIKGKRVGMADFTKQAVDLLRHFSKPEMDLLNAQWKDNSTQSGALGKMIAMVDVSGSMDGDPMNVAIALGIRIAEKSILGQRVMTFSSMPTWVNLESCPDFISKVALVKNADWGTNTNFHAALERILDVIIENKMEPEDVQDMVLVILSDMQMDQGDACNKHTLYNLMKEKYEVAGIRVHGKPYKPPHILFWNLRSTKGFPTLSNQANSSMVSGYSPALLNTFCEQGMDALLSCTPWSILEKVLSNDRYKIMADKVEQHIQI
jgi:hypothetical protein